MANYTASDITTDEQAALDQIKEETEAAVKYDIAAKNAKDPVTKKAMEHNKKDEIEHAGLMGAVAVREDPEDKSDMMAGVKELDEIKTEAVEDSFIKKSISQCIKERTRQRRSSAGATFQFEKAVHYKDVEVPMNDLRRQAKTIRETKPGKEDNLAADIRTAYLRTLYDEPNKGYRGLPRMHSASYDRGGNPLGFGNAALEEQAAEEANEEARDKQQREKLAREHTGGANGGEQAYEWDDPSKIASLQDRINEAVDYFIATSPDYDVPDRRSIEKPKEYTDEEMDAMSNEELDEAKRLQDEYEAAMAPTEYEQAVAALVDQLDDIMYSEEAKSRRAADPEDELADIDDIDQFNTDVSDFNKTVRPRLIPEWTDADAEDARAREAAQAQALVDAGFASSLEEAQGMVEPIWSYGTYDPVKSKEADLRSWHIKSKDMPNLVNRANKAALRDYALRLAQARLRDQGHDMAGKDIGRLIAEDNGKWLDKRLKSTLALSLARKGLAFNPDDFADLIGDDLVKQAKLTGLTSEDIENYVRGNVQSEFDERNERIQNASSEDLIKQNAGVGRIADKVADWKEKTTRDDELKSGATWDEANAKAKGERSKIDTEPTRLKSSNDYDAEVAKRMKAISDRYSEKYGGNYLIRNLPRNMRNIDTGLNLHNFILNNGGDTNISLSPRLEYDDEQLRDQWNLAGIPDNMIDTFRDMLDEKIMSGEYTEENIEDGVSEVLDDLGIAGDVDKDYLMSWIVINDPSDGDDIDVSSDPMLMNMYNEQEVKTKTAARVKELLDYILDEDNEASINKVLKSTGVSGEDYFDFIKTLGDIVEMKQGAAYDSNFDDSEVKSPSVYNSGLFRAFENQMKSDRARAGRSDAADRLEARRENQAMEEARYYKDPKNTLDIDEDDPSAEGDIFGQLENEGQVIEEKENKIQDKVYGNPNPLIDLEKDTVDLSPSVSETLGKQIANSTANRKAIPKLVDTVKKMYKETPSNQFIVRQQWSDLLKKIKGLDSDSWIGNYASLVTHPKYAQALNRILAEDKAMRPLVDEQGKPVMEPVLDKDGNPVMVDALDEMGRKVMSKNRDATGRLIPEKTQKMKEKMGPVEPIKGRLYSPQNKDALAWLRDNGYLLNAGAESGQNLSDDFSAGTDFQSRMGAALSSINDTNNGLTGFLDFLDNFPSASQLERRLIKEGLSREEIDNIMDAANSLDAYRARHGKKAADSIRDMDTRASKPFEYNGDPRVISVERPNGKPIEDYKPMKSEFHTKPWNTYTYDKDGKFKDVKHDRAPLYAAPDDVLGYYNDLVKKLTDFQANGDTSSPEYLETKKAYDKMMEKWTSDTPEQLGLDRDWWTNEWVSERDPTIPHNVGYTDEDRTAMQQIISGLDKKLMHMDPKVHKIIEDTYSPKEALELLQRYGGSISSPIDKEEAMDVAAQAYRDDDDDAIKNLKSNLKKVEGGQRYKGDLEDFIGWASTMMKNPAAKVLGGSDTVREDGKEKGDWVLNQLAAATYVPGARERTPRKDGSRRIVMRTPTSKDLADKNAKRREIEAQLKAEFGDNIDDPKYADRANELFMGAFGDVGNLEAPENYAPHLLKLIESVYENDVYGDSKGDIKKIRRLAETMAPEDFINIMEPLYYSLQDKLTERDADYDAFVGGINTSGMEGSDPGEKLANKANANSIESWEEHFPGLRERYSMDTPILPDDSEKEKELWTKRFLDDRSRLDFKTGRPENISMIAPLMDLEYNDDVSNALASIEDVEAPQSAEKLRGRGISDKAKSHLEARKREKDAGKETSGEKTDGKKKAKTRERKSEQPSEEPKGEDTEKKEEAKEPKKVAPLTKSATECKCTRVRHRSDADDLPDDTGLTMKQLREPTIRDDANGSSVKHMGDPVIKKSTSELMKERMSRR